MDNDSLAILHGENVINDEEFVLLYDLESSGNLYLPHNKYERFVLDDLENDECIANFRFEKEDLWHLADALSLPRDGFSCSNGTRSGALEALCIFSRRHCYPCRYLDLIPMFGRSVHELRLINNTFLNFMYTRWSHLLQTMNQPWLSPLNLELYADKIHSKGAALNNCWGFVDGTVQPVCRPGSNQRILYNGHKRVHSIKFQAVSAPNGLCAHLSGPFEGKKHDSSMLHDSGLLPQLEQHSFNGNGDIL